MMRKASVLILGLVFCSLVTVSHDTQANTEDARRAAQTAEAFIARDEFGAAMKALSSVDCQGDMDCNTLVYWHARFIRKVAKFCQPWRWQTSYDRAADLRNHVTR